jgi:hypothetical protein
MENVPADGQSREIVTYNPEIEQPLRDGYRIHGFSSGGGLRVIRIEDIAGKLVGYGEAPQVEEALEHAALDYRLGHETYEQQYSGENARHVNYWTGTTEISSPLDGHLRFGATFDAQTNAEGEGIEVSLAGSKFPPEVPDGITEYVADTMESVTFRERGVTYLAEPCQFPNGDIGASIKVLSNPDNIDTSHYQYIKTGLGQTFTEAVTAAFDAPEVELM